MSLTTYSRDYLQSIPQKKKEEQVDAIVQGFLRDIHTTALNGGTSYRYVKPDDYSLIMSEPGAPALTDSEIVAGFFLRFPGCKVYYEDIIVENSNRKTLKKSIVIDWS